MKNAWIVCLALFLVISIGSVSSAQERPRADEILRWFPYGFYSHIEHRDDTLLQQGESWQLFKDYLDRPDPFAEENALPPTLQEGIEARTMAQLLRLKQHELSAATLKEFALNEADAKKEDKATVEGKEEDQGNEPLRIPEGTNMTIMSNVGDRLNVYRYDILDTRIEEALKKGEIADSGRRINERPIYRFRSRDESGDKGIYAYATVEGELLIATRLRNLALMVAAGTGAEMNMLDSEDYLDLIGLVPELGQKWQAFCSRAMNRSMIEQMRKDGEEEEKIAGLEENFGRDASLHVETVDVGEQIVERRLEVYADEETAREMMNKGMQRRLTIGQIPDEVEQHEHSLDAARKTEQVDNMIVTTVVYDRKLLESAKASNDAMQKMIDQAKKDGAGKGQMIIMVKQKEEKK